LPTVILASRFVILTEEAQMPGSIGPMELILLLVFALLVFGPKRLPEMGRSLGKGMREFKSSVMGEPQPEELAAPSEVKDTPGSIGAERSTAPAAVQAANADRGQ
jgi:sec-independent protein translocase protein TatA